MTTIRLGYHNAPGEHCGSAAMRNLLAHYCGRELSEAAVFGLGSGLDLLYLESEQNEPGVCAFGRSVTMEIDLASALGVDYQETAEFDDTRAWEQVREEVLAGRPTMLSGDIFHLDYREFQVHFPAHRFVLVGIDDDTETAWIADRFDPEAQPCSYGALARSRNPRDAITTFNLWGKFHGTEIRHTPEQAYETALARSVRRMTGQEDTQGHLIEMMSGARELRATTGLAGLARYAEQLPSWATRDDRDTVASYAGNTIEKFGTGGGNFRNLYAAFLREAHTVVPQLVDSTLPGLATRSAERWTALASLLTAEPRTDGMWRDGATLLGEIRAIETRLFETLAQRVPGG